MKFLTFIFAVYIMAMPCIPCADADECKDSAQVNTQQTADQREHEDEACNPFCSCTCCVHTSSPTIQLIKIVADRPLAAQKQQGFDKNISLSSDFFCNIWQPPKMS